MTGATTWHASACRRAESDAVARFFPHNPERKEISAAGGDQSQASKKKRKALIGTSRKKRTKDKEKKKWTGL